MKDWRRSSGAFYCFNHLLLSRELFGTIIITGFSTDFLNVENKVGNRRHAMGAQGRMATRDLPRC